MQHHLQHLLANRRSPETRAFYLSLLGYVERRVQAVWRQRYRDLLGPSDLEEVVSDVGMRLMTGALVRFRGDTTGELYAYVRIISDRSLGKVVRRRLRERAALDEIRVDGSAEFMGQPRPPDRGAEIEAQCPLEEKDREYLLALLSAGSKAEYARRQNQSRAAVTRMVQRIRTRIEALDPDLRVAAEVWMQQQAQEAIAAGAMLQ
ncbi:MAG: hypothetical protein ABIO70_03345 [Pseudomonadota bacterium]